MNTVKNHRLGALAACLCLGLITSCGDDDTSGDNNNTQQDATVDAAPDAATGDSVTFVVLTYSDADATYIPTAGANVAFDAPGGERTEVDTGADGKATFGGIDWTTGEAAVTVHLFGHAMISVVHLDPDRLSAWVDDNGDYPMELESLIPPTPPDTVTVSGTATGLASTAHQYGVYAADTLVTTDAWAGIGTQGYSIEAPSGEPFILRAVEYDYSELPSGQGYDRPIYQWMNMDYGPITADAVDVELDFTAHAMTTHTADVSMVMPPRADSPIRTGDIPYCYFCSSNSLYCQGWPTYVDVVDGQNRVDISFLWVEPAYVQGPFWFCYVRATTGEMAQTRVPGTPVQDAQATLMDPPTWVTPADPLVAHPLHAPMEWEWREDVTESAVVVRRGGTNVWYVRGGANATTLTVPAAPSAVDETQIIGSSPTAMVTGGTMDDDGSVFARYAQSLATQIEP